MSTNGRLAALLSAVLFGSAAVASLAQSSAAEQAFVLDSPAMKAGEAIPAVYTQYPPGTDLSPPLAWRNVPDGTQAFALILDGPAYGVRRDPFVHWVVYNLPATATGLPEGLPSEAKLERPASVAGITHGRTAWPTPGYYGPFPPFSANDEVQEFQFTLYALDADLDLEPGLDKAALLKAIENHVIGRAELRVICCGPFRG